VTSVTFVDGVKSTVAVPAAWVTWTALPDTEAISPLTWSLPFADADDDCDDEVGEADVGLADEVGLALSDVPHAATDSAVAPVTARIANGVSRAVGKVKDI
jgi:hypothetical protein